MVRGDVFTWINYLSNLRMEKRRLSSDSSHESSHDPSHDEELEYRCTLTQSCLHLTFSSAESFERHHQQFHSFVCSQCHRCLPTSHILDLHIQELHSSYFAEKAKLGKAYRCIAQDCDDAFNSPRGRRLHCLAKHGYPDFFDFDVILGHNFQDLLNGTARAFYAKSSDSRKPPTRLVSSKSNPIKPHTSSTQKKTIKPVESDDMELDSTFKKMHVTAPKQISFGRGAHRAFGSGKPSKPILSDDQVKSLHTHNIPKEFTRTVPKSNLEHLAAPATRIVQPDLTHRRSDV
jgi:hypothetical protein